MRCSRNSTFDVARRRSNALVWATVISLIFSATTAVRLVRSAEGEPDTASTEAADPERTAKIAETNRLTDEYYKQIAEGDFEAALASARQIMAIEEDLYTEDESAWINTLDMVADALLLCDRIDEAREYAQQMHDICLRSRGEKHWRTVSARTFLDTLALIEGLSDEDRARLARARQLHSHVNRILGTGALEQAQREADEAYAIRRELLGEMHPLTLGAKFTVANVTDWRDHDREAFELFKQVLEARRKIFSAEVCPDGHPATAEVLFFLGSVANNLDETEAAEQYTTESLEIRRRIYPADRYPRGHVEIMRCLRQLGQIYEDYDTDRYKQSADFFDQALAMARKIYPTSEYPRGSWLLVDCLNSCGKIRVNTSRLAESLPFFNEAVDVCGRLYPKDEYPHGTSRYAESLRRQADALSKLSRRAEALQALVLAQAMYEASYGPHNFPDGHVTLAQFYRELGLAYHHAHYPEKGLHYVRAALDIYRRRYPADQYPNGHWNLLDGLYALIDMLNAQRKNEEIPALLAEYKAMAEARYPAEEYPEGHSRLAKFYYISGMWYLDMSNLAAARRAFMQALEANRRLYPPSRSPNGHFRTANCLEMLGVTLHIQGEYEDSVSFYQQNLAMRLRLLPPDRYPDGHRDIISAYQNMAMPLRKLGRYDEAEKYLRLALAMAENLHPPELYPHGDSSIAIVNDNLGNLLMDQKKYEEAAKHYAAALRIDRQLYPKERFPRGHESMIYAMLNLGDALVRMGASSEEWLAYSEQALAMAERLYPADVYPHGHILLIAALSKRSSDLILSEDTEGAQEVLERLVSVKLDYAWHEMTNTATEILVRFMEDVKFDFDRLLTLAVHSGRQDPELSAKIYRWGVMQKSIVIDALIRMRNIQREMASHPDLAAMDAYVRQLRTQLAALALSAPEGDGDDQYAKRRARLALELETAENDLMLSLNEQAGRYPAQSFSLAGMQAWLADHPKTAVVEILEYTPVMPGISNKNGLDFRDKRYVAFVLVHGKELQVIDLGQIKLINKQIAALRELVRRTARDFRFEGEFELEKQYKAVARKIYDMIFSPLVPHLGDVDTVCIAPDGELNRIPLQALVDGQGRYLIERYAFGYLSSASDLLRPQAEPGEGVAVFADPAYDLALDEQQQQVAALSGDALVDALLDDVAVRAALVDATRGLNWKRLPATAIEAEMIGELFSGGGWGQVDIYTGNSALEELLKRVHRPLILHLATHGYYLEAQADSGDDGDDPDTRGQVVSSQIFARLRAVQNPLLRSGLVLAGANTLLAAAADEAAAHEDGWITAEEVSSLDLLGTELVVLSACETGLGDIRAGENVSGLRRAFLQAGARTLITSLYKVPDSATQALMSEFYKRLAAGATKLEALRDAQLAIIAQRRHSQEAAHPFFWASFVLVGDPD